LIMSITIFKNDMDSIKVIISLYYDLNINF